MKSPFTRRAGLSRAGVLAKRILLTSSVLLVFLLLNIKIKLLLLKFILQFNYLPSRFGHGRTIDIAQNR